MKSMKRQNTLQEKPFYLLLRRRCGRIYRRILCQRKSVKIVCWKIWCAPVFAVTVGEIKDGSQRMQEREAKCTSILLDAGSFYKLDSFGLVSMDSFK